MRITSAVHPGIQKLREYALRYAEAEEGVACEGTVLEKRTIKARKKAFVFLGIDDVMLKLRDSLDEVAKHGTHKVGAHGWVTVRVDEADVPQLERWIDESYRLVVGVTSKKRAG